MTPPCWPNGALLPWAMIRSSQWTEGSPDLPLWVRRALAADLTPQIVDGADVLVWRITDDQSTASISEQFKANASDYHQRYAASDHFEQLFREGLIDSAIQIADTPTILDLGSGSGVNSVIPCVRLFPGAKIVATDLSAELLALLAEYLRSAGGAQDVACVQMDAMADHAAPGTFDLVTGASILHHLERPEDGLRAAARALKPGGHAMFFEPFDGWALMRLAFERILAEAALHREPLHPLVAGALHAMVADICARTDPDPTSSRFTQLDDKWLFSREWVERAANDAGFAAAQIVPHNAETNLYQLIGPIQIRLCTGRADLELPDWAMAILAAQDAAIPPPMKRASPLEATVVLTK